MACGRRSIQCIRIGVGRTSPHQITRSSDGKSPCSKASNLAMYVKVDGTENHWVSSESRISAASLFGIRLAAAGTRCSSAPARNVP